MALTNIDTIKKIIQNTSVYKPTIYNEKIQLTLFEAGQIPNTNIVTDTENIKIIRQNEPTLDSKSPITLNNQDPVSLSNSLIVENTVVVASSLLLSVVYTENKDYIIDYYTGKIERTSLGSSITSRSQVYVWFIPFIKLSSGSDYNIDYSAGTIKRRAGTSIPNKASIYVDYTHAQNVPMDDAIYECIYEMEAFLENKLKAGFDFDSDNRALKSAATNFSIYLLCLAQAFKELTIASKTSSDDIAKQWFSLADKYLKVAKDLFGPFLLTSTKQIGGLIQNRFTTNRSRTTQSPSVPLTIRRH